MSALLKRYLLFNIKRGRYFVTVIAALAILFITQNCFSQDVIYTTSGGALKCKINEIGEDSVSYAETGRPATEIKYLRKKQINKIKYENGYEETYNKLDVAATTATNKTAQANYDIIVTIDGDQLKVIVKEVDETSIDYTRVGGTGIDKISLKKVAGIHYANGYEEIYNKPPTLKEFVVVGKNEKTTSDSAQTQGPGLARDVIKLRNGKEIQGKILEVDEANVQFIAAGAAEAKPASLPLYAILKISYANGFEEVYTQYKNPNDALAPIAKTVLPVKPDVPETKVGSDKKGAEKKVPEKKKTDKKTDDIATVKPPKTAIQEFTLPEVEKLTRFTSIADALKDPLKVEFLDLSGKGLKALPPELSQFKNLVAINLNQNQLRNFPVELLDAPLLQYVWLDNTGISNFKIEDLAKAGQTNIAFLSLNNNKLTKISSSLLSIGSLKELRLNYNQISSINTDKNFDPKNSNLQVIELQKNRFSQIPAELSALPNLSSLNLSENNIKSVDKELTGYKQVRSLKLSGNLIKSIDPSLYNLSALEELNLNQTLISGLPDSISKLSGLKSLILPNTFSQFPADFGQLKKLTELHVTSGIINGFPKVILGCTRLKTLDISGASLNSIPPEIGTLSRLENVYLTNCSLTTCPKELLTLPGLKVLDLGNNKITKIPVITTNWPPTETLNLQNSPLDASSLLMLRRNLPYAQINYFDSDFGLNFTSKPLPSNYLTSFKRLFAACDQKDPAAFFELGEFFKKNEDYGLAVKAFRVVSDDPSLEGTGKAVTCMLTIAEIYDDVDNVKPYSSPYKRKRYSDYTDYSTTSANNKAYSMYNDIINVYPKDEIAHQAQKKACARASIISSEMADNLAKIFDDNNREIERLIQAAGTSQAIAATGDKIMNDSSVSGSQAGVLLGGLGSLLGKVSAMNQDNKANRLKGENEHLKSEIESLRSRASDLLNRQ